MLHILCFPQSQGLEQYQAKQTTQLNKGQQNPKETLYIEINGAVPPPQISVPEEIYTHFKQQYIFYIKKKVKSSFKNFVFHFFFTICVVDEPTLKILLNALARACLKCNGNVQA